MNPIASNLSWRIQKTQHLWQLFARNVPRFVYQSAPDSLEGEIPVFTFHQAIPDDFDRQCHYLATNGYKTLSADEFLHALVHRSLPVRNSVVLTFDDGLKSVWTVAVPILRKYGLQAICFLVPGCIPEEDGIARPTLAEVETGNARWHDVVDPESGPEAFMKWSEIKALHESGIIDFQSHSLRHHVVPVSNRIIDFMHPRYDTWVGNFHVPLYTEQGRDQVSRQPSLGMPIYAAEPRMQAERRYFDDEAIRHECVRHVREHGGPAFFHQSRWRRRLRRIVSTYRSRRGERGRYETVAERDRDLRDDLRQSREIIEEKLPGKKVTHLCYPWYDAGSFAIEASKASGFYANYFGNVWGRPTNYPGDDTFRIVRLEGYLVERLPGHGRMRAKDIFQRLYGNRRVSDVST